MAAILHYDRLIRESAAKAAANRFAVLYAYFRGPSPATKTAKAKHGSALQRLKEVCEKATPGPWKLDLRDYKIIGESERPVARLVWEWTIGNKDLKNACFIATARTALPAIIELCEAQERLITAKTSKRLKGALGRACLDREYLHALSDLHAAMKAVEVAKARLEEVCA